MKRLPLLTFIFSIVFAVFFIAPAFLGKQFGPYPLIKFGDLIDIFTPLVLIPLYWLMFRFGTDKAPGATETITFFVLAALWVEGQGMHLAANSIGYYLKGFTGTDAYNVTNFYDEVLSHYMWHGGVIGLSLLLVLHQWKTPLTEVQTGKWLQGVAGVIYGFNLLHNHHRGGNDAPGRALRSPVYTVLPDMGTEEAKTATNSSFLCCCLFNCLNILRRLGYLLGWAA